MPVYMLIDELVFPPVGEAEPDGLLAVGGDLTPQRLLLAYRSGIFPWYSDDLPMLWFSPDPRMVLFPEKLHVPKSLARVLASDRFSVTFDRDFAGVIRNCRIVPRTGQDGTWITEDMQAAYITLHELGHAHSVEVWQDEKLVGGLYGVTIGRSYAGESMFSLVPDASKVAFVHLVRHLQEEGINLIDCQVYTEHLERFGAELISRSEFMELLAAANRP